MKPNLKTIKSSKYYELNRREKKYHLIQNLGATLALWKFYYFTSVLWSKKNTEIIA